MVIKLTKSKVVEMYVNDYARKFYLREFETLLNKPHQTIKPYAEELAKEGILEKSPRVNLVEYGLNFKNPLVYDYLVIAEKNRLIDRIEHETLLKVIFEKLSVSFSNNIFIIFGSSVNKMNLSSDIDLLVVGNKNIGKIIDEFQEIYNKKVHVVQVLTLDELNLTLVKEIYKKHLILNNSEQVVRFFGEKYEQNKLV